MKERSIEKLVSEINESSTFARIFEVGAGVPTANKLYQYKDASKTIFSSESYYAREAHDLKFGECNSRAVSFERLRDCIFYSRDLENDIVGGLYNTIFASTFQVGDVDNNISTHGWIGINFGTVEGAYVVNNLKYYHISIHSSMTRQDYINTIGEIGVKLLHCKNEFVPSDCYIDMVLDEDGIDDYVSTLEAIANSEKKQQVVVFKKDGKVDRLESITRNVDNLIVYKGSFNPVTIAHKEVVTQTGTQYENSKITFSISVDTFQKGKVDIESLVKRIVHINNLGYSVLITNRGLYIDTIEILRTKYRENIIFPIGVDTINRLSKDYYKRMAKGTMDEMKDGLIEFYDSFDSYKFENDFKGCELVCFSRDGEEVDSLLDSGLISHMVQKHENISSSKVRELFDKQEDDTAIQMIPEEIRHYVINHYSKKK